MEIEREGFTLLVIDAKPACFSAVVVFSARVPIFREMRPTRRHVAAVCAIVFAAITFALWSSTTGPGTTGNADAADPGEPIQVTIPTAPPAAPAVPSTPMDVPEAPLEDPAPAISQHRAHRSKHP
jgi:hypothetical protein